MLHSERFWIGRGMAPVVEALPFSAFEARFAHVFSLDTERRRDLRYYLAEYHADVEALEAEQAASIEGELARLGDNCLRRIAHYVLKPEERERFDRMVAGLEAPVAADAAEVSLARPLTRPKYPWHGR